MLIKLMTTKLKRYDCILICTKLCVSFITLNLADDSIGEDPRPNSLRLQESLPKALKLEVLSSQSKVSVNVDGTTVSLVYSSLKSINTQMINDANNY